MKILKIRKLPTGAACLRERPTCVLQTGVAKGKQFHLGALSGLQKAELKDCTFLKQNMSHRNRRLCWSFQHLHLAHLCTQLCSPNAPTSLCEIERDGVPTHGESVVPGSHHLSSIQAARHLASQKPALQTNDVLHQCTCKFKSDSLLALWILFATQL